MPGLPCFSCFPGVFMLISSSDRRAETHGVKVRHEY